MALSYHVLPIIASKSTQGYGYQPFSISLYFRGSFPSDIDHNEHSKSSLQQVCEPPKLKTPTLYKQATSYLPFLNCHTTALRVLPSLSHFQRHHYITSPPHSPNILRHPSLTLFSYSGLLSLHILAASTLAGLSSFGSANILMTEIRIFSTLWMGDHRSEACS